MSRSFACAVYRRVERGIRGRHSDTSPDRGIGGDFVTLRPRTEVVECLQTNETSFTAAVPGEYRCSPGEMADGLMSDVSCAHRWFSQPNLPRTRHTCGHPNALLLARGRAVPCVVWPLRWWRCREAEAAGHPMRGTRCSCLPRFGSGDRRLGPVLVECY